MDNFAKIIIIIIIVTMCLSYIRYQPKKIYSLKKENIKPGVLNIDENLQLEITTTPKYGNNFLQINMQPQHFIHQIWYVIKGYYSNFKKGNYAYMMRLTSPVFNINLLYDQMMYFYILPYESGTQSGTQSKEKYVIMNDGDCLLLYVLK